MDSLGSIHVYRRQAPEGGISTGMVLKRVGITRARLRNWVNLGLVQPVVVGHGTRAWWCYTPDMVVRLQRILGYIEEGYSLRGAVRMAERVEEFERKQKEMSGARQETGVPEVDVGRAGTGEDPFA